MKLLGNWIVRNLLLALLIIAVLLTAAMIGLNVGTRHNKEIVVPDLRGMTVWQAREAASAAGMRVEIVDSVYSRRHRGTVRSHNPAAGEMVKEGEAMPQPHCSPGVRRPKSSVMTLRVGVAHIRGEIRFTSPTRPMGSGSRVSGSRMITRP